MNILLLAVLFTATQAATPFKWEFDLEQCVGSKGYSCFTSIDGKLTATHSHLDYKTKLAYYQMQNPVFAIRAQSSNRWIVVMQIGSRKKKFDVNYGMKLHRVLGNKTEDFLGCRLESGKVVTTSSKDIETHLIDSYSDEGNLFCDFSVTAKTGTRKNLTDIVSKTDSFAMSVRVDGKNQKCADDIDPKEDYGYFERHDYVAVVVHRYENHDCDLSRANFDPTEARKWGKVRPWEYAGNKIRCTDTRYTLYVWDSKGGKRDNAMIKCENGKYKYNDEHTWKGTERTLEPNESFNAVCYIEDKHLCPLYVPCDKKNCPEVKFYLGTDSENYHPPEYSIHCPSSIVVGEEENPFAWTNTHCNEDHRLVVSNPFPWSKGFKSPPTVATVAYCEDYEILRNRPKKPKKPTVKKEGGTTPGTSGKSSVDDEKNRENSSSLPAFSLALIALPIVAY